MFLIISILDISVQYESYLCYLSIILAEFNKPSSSTHFAVPPLLKRD